jgi:hypothetical protein
MSIPTVASLRRARARLDQRRLSAEKIVAIMRKEGQALLCSFERSGPVWWLTARCLTRNRQARDCRR